jgi:protein-tyrosine-phosphatase
VRKKLSVMYAHDPEQLVALAKSALPSGPVIVQEYFRGAGVGVELLADHGEVVYAFQHKRLHELPLTGGGSCLRESVAVHPMLLEHSKKLIAATKWHGVAMVEFKLDEATDECRLMEVNGRFWGSLPLAVAAGADFPYLLYKLMTEGRRPNAEEAKPAKLGVLCRKLSQDVYWYVQVLSPDQDEPLIKWPSKQEALSDLLLGLSPRHHFDVQSFRDPRPGIVDLGRTAEWFVGRAGAVAKQKLIAYSQARERKSGAFVDQRLKNAREVLFLCYGNINRSVLAARHLQSQLPLQARLRVTSAGFHHEEGRPADPSMVLEAAKHGLSLEASSSRRITAEMLARADVVLAMEIKHLLLMREQFPEAAPKVYLISCAAPADAEVPLEIADPYGNDAAAFARCYREITACTEAIAKGLL